MGYVSVIGKKGGRTLLIIIVMIVTNISSVFGQDVEKIFHSDSLAVSYWNSLLATDPLVLTGGLSARLSYNSSSTAQPFSYIFNGNLNTEVFGFNVPLSFTWSNKNFNYQFSSPIRFNRIKLNPHYKWVKLYLGQSSMSFSPYTLSGVQFTGVGLELTPPGGFKISLMRGRIYDSVAYDTLYPGRMPIYQRDGNAVKIGYSKSTVFIEASLFEGHDQINSVTLPADTFLAVAPYQNIAWSFKSRFSPLKAVNLEIEYASSAINYSYKFNSRSLTEMLWGDVAGISRYSAYKLAVNFSPKKFQSGFSIEHIDPDFKSLGAYYSRSDFQNITLNFAMNFFEGKVSFNGSGGIEVDNLKNQKQEVNSRTVGSANIAVRPFEKLDISLNYSNYQSFSNIKNQFDYINQPDPSVIVDTLNYLQINQNASVNLNYIINQSKEQSQRLMLMFNMNESNSSQGTTQAPGMVYYNLNAQWSYLNQLSNLGFNVGFNSTLNQSLQGNVLMLGPTVTARKQLFDKKLNVGVSMAYNSSHLSGELAAQNFNSKVSGSYTYRENHVFTLDIGFLNQKQKDKAARSSLNTSLTYSFKMKKLKLFKPIKPLPTKEGEEEN